MIRSVPPPQCVTCHAVNLSQPPPNRIARRDEQLGDQHRMRCGFWVTRPRRSYAQHLSNPDGEHYRRDGHREQGREFEYSPFNAALVRALDPVGHDERCRRCLNFACKEGSPADGGSALTADGACLGYCSPSGYCGWGSNYAKPVGRRTHIDCMTCAPAAELQSAAVQALDRLGSPL